ncbi:MAG TPA: hypothetical protein VIU65_04365 [Pyrinomonadaceae bacterium]
MARRWVKGLTMLALLLTLALATTVATANGQDQIAVKANVPFEFIVGDKTLAAGKYSVSAIGITHDALAIQGIKANDSAVRLVNTTTGSAERTSKLVFHRYGNTFFLSEVWTAGERQGRQLLKSRQERAIERELSRVAGNQTSKYQEVVILASAR